MTVAVAYLILVRSMARWTTAALLSFTVAACAVSPTPAVRAPSVDGPYATRMTAADALQIVALANTRSDIGKPVFFIYAQNPDEGNVSSGTSEGGDRLTFFRVRKTSGGWQIVKGSIDHPEVLRRTFGE